MSLSRRDFMQLLAAASAAGMALDHRDALAATAGAGERLYDVPSFGNVSFLHFTDCHAQLTPVYFREPGMNLGVGEATGTGVGVGLAAAAARVAVGEGVGVATGTGTPVEQAARARADRQSNLVRMSPM